MSRKLGGHHGKGHHRKKRIQERREVAERIAEDRAKRSPEEQLARLDNKLGKGVGAKKERLRLLNEIAKRKKKAPDVTSDGASTKRGKGGRKDNR